MQVPAHNVGLGILDQGDGRPASDVPGCQRGSQDAGRINQVREGRKRDVYLVEAAVLVLRKRARRRDILLGIRLYVCNQEWATDTYGLNVICLFSGQINIRVDVPEIKGGLVADASKESVNYIELPPCPPPTLLHHWDALTVSCCKGPLVHLNRQRQRFGLPQCRFRALILTAPLQDEGKEHEGLNGESCRR